MTTSAIPGTSPTYEPLTSPCYEPITNPDYSPKTTSPQPPEINTPFVPFFTTDSAWYMVITSIKCRDCGNVEKTTHYVRKDFDGTLTQVCPKCHSHRVEELSRQYYPRITGGGCTSGGSYSVEMEWPNIAKDMVAIELECELCGEKSKHNIEVDKSSAAANDGRMYTYTCNKCGRLNHEMVGNSAPYVTPRPKADSKYTVEVNTKLEQTDTSYTYTCKDCDTKFEFPDKIHYCPYCGGRVNLYGISMTFNLSTR